MALVCITIDRGDYWHVVCLWRVSGVVLNGRNLISLCSLFRSYRAKLGLFSIASFANNIFVVCVSLNMRCCRRSSIHISAFCEEHIHTSLSIFCFFVALKLLRNLDIDNLPNMSMTSIPCQFLEPVDTVIPFVNVTLSKQV